MDSSCVNPAINEREIVFWGGISTMCRQKKILRKLLKIRFLVTKGIISFRMLAYNYYYTRTHHICQRKTGDAESSTQSLERGIYFASTYVYNLQTYALLSADFSDFKVCRKIHYSTWAFRKHVLSLELTLYRTGLFRRFRNKAFLSACSRDTTREQAASMPDSRFRQFTSSLFLLFQSHGSAVSVCVQGERD